MTSTTTSPKSNEMSSSFLASMYLYLAEGTVIIITNSVLVYCILGKKKNRERREFLLIVAQALADTSYAVAFMLIAVHRLNLAAAKQEDGVSTVWECALKPALPLHNWATPLLGILPLTTSLNFLVCSVFPLWYLRAGWTYTLVLLSCPHAVSLFLSVLNYILLWGDTSLTPAMCVAAKGAAHHVAYGGMLSLRMLANLASAIIYTCIILYLRKGQRLQELTAHQRKTHRNAAITLGFVTLNSFLLLFIPDILLFFNPANINKDYSTLLYSMTLSKTTINFFIYMWRYGELADMVVAATCRRVPRLRKYFPERSIGFRSSQIGDSTVGRFSAVQRSSFVSDISRKPIVSRGRRGTSKVSPKQLEIPPMRKLPMVRKDEAPLDTVPSVEGAENRTPVPVASPPSTPKEPEPVAAPLGETESPTGQEPTGDDPVAWDDCPAGPAGDTHEEENPDSFLPPIALFSRPRQDLISGFDNRTFWSND